MLGQTLNRTRQIYHKMLQGSKASDGQVDEAIAISQDFKNLLEHPGWRRLETWIEKQKQGEHEYMEHEVQNINAITLVGIFNTFFKYLWLLQERRAYNKIKQYINVSINVGEKYAQQKAKQEERQSK